MKKIKLFLLYAMATSFCWAQEIEWQNTIGGNSADYLYSIQQTSDGGYILGGTSVSNISGDKTEMSNGGYDYWIVKTDSFGSILWQNTIGGSDADWLYSVKQTLDGGYILGGYSVSPVSGDKSDLCYNNSWDYWIVKTDSMGNVQWDKTIGSANHDWLYSIQQTTDGGYILGGFIYYQFLDYDYLIVKTDTLGNTQWQKIIGGSDDDWLYSIQQTSDGGYILGGHSESNISGDKTENNMGPDYTSDYWIVKTDSSGTIQWQNTIGGNLDDYLCSIKQTADGGYILGGTSNTSISGDKTEFSNGIYDYWIVKTNSTGIIQWQNTIGGNNRDSLQSIQQTADGGYILGGYSNSNISGDKTENSMGSNDYWIVKTDSTGIIQWQNTIGGSGDEKLYNSIQQTTDWGYILGGYSNSNISVDKIENCMGNYDYWIVKLTSNYNSITGNAFADINSNGVYDGNEYPITQNKITELTTGRFNFSQSSGLYNIAVLDSGNYTVIPTQLNFYNTVPVTHTATFTGGFQQTDSLNDFAFQPAGVFNDLCVTITPLGPFRAGFNASYMINYGNYGTTSLSGDVIFFPFNNVTYISSSVTPTAVTLDSVVWSTGVLTPFQTGSIIVTVNVNTGLPIGTLINSSVRIEPIANDANPGCNYHAWEVITTGSYDPNDILVNEDTLTTTQLATAPYLDYIILFQNTGNDTAFAVKVLNPVDTNKLELSTIEFVNASHPVNLNWINYQRNMEFKFDNILLPDSNINEPMSHGFVHYRIKPKTTLLAGDSVTNNAYIYFDFNAPVATNTAVTKIVLPTGLTPSPSPKERGALVCYPNPTANELTVSGYVLSTNEKATLKVFDVYGKEVFSTRIAAANCKLQTANYPKGIYFVQVGALRAKFVKQ